MHNYDPHSNESRGHIRASNENPFCNSNYSSNNGQDSNRMHNYDPHGYSDSHRYCSPLVATHDPQSFSSHYNQYGVPRSLFTSQRISVAIFGHSNAALLVEYLGNEITPVVKVGDNERRLPPVRLIGATDNGLSYDQLDRCRSLLQWLSSQSPTIVIFMLGANSVGSVRGRDCVRRYATTFYSLARKILSRSIFVSCQAEFRNYPSGNIHQAPTLAEGYLSERNAFNKFLNDDLRPRKLTDHILMFGGYGRLDDPDNFADDGVHFSINGLKIVKYNVLRMLGWVINRYEM